MKVYTAVIEKCPDTGLYVGYVPSLAGAHSQGETLEEFRNNLKEVIEMLLEDGEPEVKKRIYRLYRHPNHSCRLKWESIRS